MTSRDIINYLAIVVSIIASYLGIVIECTSISTKTRQGVCMGHVTLHHDEYSFNITSNELRFIDENEPKKWFKHITKKHPTTKEKLKYKLVTAFGNCCWKFRERLIGGKKFSISRSETDGKWWAIKKVVLDPNCFIDAEDEKQCEGRSCVKLMLDQEKISAAKYNYATVDPEPRDTTISSSLIMEYDTIRDTEMTNKTYVEEVRIHNGNAAYDNDAFTSGSHSPSMWVYYNTLLISTLVIIAKRCH